MKITNVQRKKKMNNICNFEKKDTISFISPKNLENLKCHTCQEIKPDPIQSSSGCIFCFRCFFSSSSGIDRLFNKDNNVFDKRIQAKLILQEIKCPFYTKGCDWIGEFQEYTHHLSNDCIFPMTKCEHCEMIVSLKDIKTHYDENMCKSHHTTVTFCPNDCGYINQRWLIKSHVILDCPKALLRCMFEYECTSGCSKDAIVRRRSICQTNVIDNILFEFQNRVHEQIKVECDGVFNSNKELIPCCEVLLIGNREKIIFVWGQNKDSNHLNLKLMRFKPHTYQTTILDVLKNTVITVSLVNQNRKQNDGVDRKYIRMLSIDNDDLTAILFAEPRFIQIDDLFDNKKTGTCYIDDAKGMCQIVIDFYFPCALTFKHNI